MSRGGTRDVEGDLNLAAHPEVLLAMHSVIGPVEVYIVDGVLFRKHIYLNYTQGGNWMAYPWLKKKVILLEDANFRDRDPILFHELYEANCMEQEGEKYDVAHEHADEIEIKIRRGECSFQEEFEEQKQKLLRFYAKKQSKMMGAVILGHKESY